LNIAKFNQWVKESNSITVSIENKSIEAYDFIKKFFPDMPISYEYFIEKSHIYTCVARHNGEIIGVNVFNINKGGLSSIMIPKGQSTSKEKIHSNYTAVSPEWRGKDVNMKLKKCIKEFAKSKGIDIITANVDPENLISSKSLIKSGFVKNPEVNDKGWYTHYLKC
jgi:predicted GNAT superfamily acetyltransferase